MRFRLRFAGLAQRDAEVAALEQALEHAQNRAPSVTVIIGAAGIGKSRLVRHAVDRARARNAIPLRGECVRVAGGELPYAPLAAALRDAPQDVMEAALAQLPSEARADLALVLPRLAPPGAAAADQSQASRFQLARLFDLLLWLLDALARRHPLLFVLEDFQWVDASTREFVRFLARALRHERIAVLVTHREQELAPDDPVERLLAELRGLALVTFVRPRPLEHDALAEQIALVLGKPPPAGLVDDVYRHSQGNPLFAEALLAARLEGHEVGLPASVTELVLARCAPLSGDAREALRYLAAAGRPIDVALLAAAMERPQEEVAGLLREAIARRLLEYRPQDRVVAFVHDTVREAVYKDLCPGEAPVHAALARALQARWAPGDGHAELALHWECAGHDRPALVAAVRAGIETEKARAFMDARRHFASALKRWNRVPDATAAVGLDRVDLLGHAADVEKQSGCYKIGEKLCGDALELLDEERDPARVAAFQERLGRLQTFAGDSGLAAFRQALRVLPADDRVGRARLMSRDAHALWALHDYQEAARRAEQALAIATSAQAPTEAAIARMSLGVAIAYGRCWEEGERHLRAAVRELAGLGCPDEHLYARAALAEVLRLRGRFSDALVETLKGETYARELRLSRTTNGRFLTLNAAADMLLLGRWTDADAKIAYLEAHDLEPWDVLILECVRAQLCLGRGDFRGAADALARARTRSKKAPGEYVAEVYAGLAELELWADRPDAAYALIEEGLSAMQGERDPLYVPVLLSMGARAGADKAVRGGDGRDRARRHAGRMLAELQELVADRDGRVPPLAEAHLSVARGEVARAEGAHADASAAYEEAAGRWKAIGAPYLEGYARWRQAEALLAGRLGRADAETLITQAHAAAVRLGAKPLVTELEGLAARAGLRAPEEAASAVTGAAAFGLTPREREVLELLAARKKDKEIAAALFITPKTAQLHVRHILAKLNVRNRWEAAEKSHREGLIPAHTP